MENTWARTGSVGWRDGELNTDEKLNSFTASEEQTDELLSPKTKSDSVELQIQLQLLTISTFNEI